MKYAAYGLLAAFLAAAVYGAIPDTAAGWYTPDKFSIEETSGILEVQTTDEYGNTDTIEYPVYVDETGYVVGMDGVDLTDDVLDSVSYKALQAFVLAVRNKERIETIGNNLYALTSKDGIHIRNENTGQEFTIKFGGSIASAVSGESGDIPATSDAADPVDGSSLGWRSDGKLQVSAWDTVPSAGDTLANKLINGTGHVNNPARSLALVTRTSEGRLRYLAIGVLSSMMTVDGKSIETNAQNEASVCGYDGAREGTVAYKTADGLEWRVPEDVTSVDGSSITTNSEDGASSSGVASLYGWSNASAEDFPRRGSDGHLEWKSPDELVDGTSLAWATVDGGKVFEVKDAHAYAGHHSRHYFGTSTDKTAALGWHELPNVTTNRVEGDEATIASTVDEQDPGIKRLGLRKWDYQHGGDPLFVVNDGGSIGYMPLPALTNLAACACTNKWNAMLDWIGDGEVGDDGLTFESEDLDHYLYGTLGYIYSTTPDNLYFDNDGEQIEASFTAPSNWADGDSVELTSEGAYQVAGWADASACAASMSAMLSSPEGSDATTHLLLAKKTDTGELHYVAIGDGVQSGAAVDDTTITTNTAYGAVTMGVASLRGWNSAANDTYLSKNEGGSLEWRKVDPVPGVDGASIVTNTAKQLTLKGYAAAENNAVPMKTAQGLSWLKASSATNFLLAGAGINITDNGGGAITISAQALEDASAAPKTVSVVTAIQYNETTHTLQVKRRTLTFSGSVSQEPDAWEDVFTAVSHASEHQGE